MTSLIIFTGLIFVFVFVWFYEPRIFLFLFHRLIFPPRKGVSLHIDKAIEFPGSEALEKHWNVMYEELKTAMSGNRILPKFHEVDRSNSKISFDEGPSWRTIVIKAYDGWFTSNSARFPQTSKLLKGIPSVSTAMFSILDPRVNIPPHTGKFSGIMRYHLALLVPHAGRCYIEVNGEKYYWKTGEGILFDDTYLHSVTNETDDYRIVLFLDIKKRTSWAVNKMNQFILYLIRISPVFRRALKNGMIQMD